MNYYLKKFFIIMLYLISSGVIAAAVLSIEGLAWVKLILLTLNFALFSFIYCGIALKDGEKALKVRMSNDKMRELIVKTGDDYKLNLNDEFTVKKGFIAGAVASLPLVLLILLRLLTGESAIGAIIVQAIQLFYMVFYGFFNLDFLGVQKSVLYASHYWALIAIPFLVIVHGVFYYLGGKNFMRQQEKIKQTHRRLHGE